MRVNFVFYILYFVLNILYLMRTYHTRTYSFLHLLQLNQSTYYHIVDCWKESTARKTHRKQPHFYPIISYQIQKLSIRQHNVLAFLKKYLVKTFHTWTREIGFVCLSICLSFSYMKGPIVGNLTPYNRRDLLLSLL